MKFGFEEPQALYESGSQNARIWTERWVGSSLYCPNCGHERITQFVANRPVADFFCSVCSEEFELKSQKRPFGGKIVDGAFHTMSDRVAAENNPSLLLLRYDFEHREVRDVTVVPKQFFVSEIIEKRKPLNPTARRANWVGCNILLGQIPSAGKIQLVRNGAEVAKEIVLAQWRQMLFLRDTHGESRGWLLEVLRCVEMIGRAEFDLAAAYQFEDRLRAIFPDNHHVREKIRQQLQVLRDNGYIEFVGRGQYRLQAVDR